MEYVKLGNTGMEVSKLCLGCMGFGEPERGREKWSIGEAESREVIKKALDSGINFFDTANLYSAGYVSIFSMQSSETLRVLPI